MSLPPVELASLHALAQSILVELIPELEGAASLDADLEQELGANSIDRADLVQLCLERSGRDLAMRAFAQVRTLRQLAAVLAEPA